jgi:hypothetical protein
MPPEPHQIIAPRAWMWLSSFAYINLRITPTPAL